MKINKKNKRSIPLVISGSMGIVASTVATIGISNCADFDKIPDFKVSIIDESVLTAHHLFYDTAFFIRCTIDLSNADLAKYDITWDLDFINDKAKENKDKFEWDSSNGEINVKKGLLAHNYELDFKCTATDGKHTKTVKCFMTLVINEPPLIDGTNWSGRKSGTIEFRVNDDEESVTLLEASDNFVAVDLVIPDQVWDGTKFYKVTRIGSPIDGYQNFAYADLSGTLTLPEHLTWLDGSAFYGKSKLTDSLTIPDGVTQIGNQAFNYCFGFNGTLTLPENLDLISGRAFYNCHSFTGSLIFPEKTRWISDQAFGECSSFDGTLSIPANIQLIGPKAFENMKKISRIDWHPVNKTKFIGPFDTTIFTGVGSEVTGDKFIYVTSTTTWQLSDFDTLEANGWQIKQFTTN